MKWINRWMEKRFLDALIEFSKRVPTAEIQVPRAKDCKDPVNVTLSHCFLLNGLTIKAVED